MNFNFNHLYYFYEVARAKSFTAAAKRLRTSQSSLSIQISTLEKSMGEKLFRKVGRRIALTSFGNLVFQSAQSAFLTFERLETKLEKQSEEQVRITFGVSTDVGRAYFARNLAKIKMADASAKPILNIISLPSSYLLNQLKLGEIDFLLTTRIVAEPSLRVIAEFDLPVGAFIKAENSSRSSDMRGYRTAPGHFKDSRAYVLPSSLTGLRSEIDHYFAKKNFSPHTVFESNVISSVVEATTSGMGISILPEAYLKQELKTKKVVQLNTRPLFRHRLTLLSLKENLDAEKTEFAARLIDQMFEG